MFVHIILSQVDGSDPLGGIILFFSSISSCHANEFYLWSSTFFFHLQLLGIGN